MIDMGDKIEFPFNNRMYFEQAVEHIEKNEFEAALECIEKVYAENKGNIVNHLYTLILYTLDRFEEALEIASEQKDFYIEQEKHAVLYTTLLIKNQLFLEAEVLIQDHIINTYSFYYPEWHKLEKELELERELINFEIEMEKNRTKRELTELDSYSPMKQSEIVENARHLELRDLQISATLVFGNPYTSGVTQRGFLELLVEKKDTNEYLFPWFNQQRNIIPNELEVFDQTPTVKQMDQLLEEKLHKYPSMFELVKNEIINDLLMLYPFIEEVITDIDYWINCYIETMDVSNQLEIDTTPLSDEQKEIKKWVEHLNRLAQRNTPPK